MPFYAVATAAPTDYEPIDDDVYEAVIARIESFMGTKYGTTEPKEFAKIIWTITGGDFDGREVDALYNPSLNENSKLFPVFRAITGKTPSPGERYDLEAELVGKACRIQTESTTTDRGGVFSHVASVLPAKKTKTRVVVEADDELEDA